MWNPTLIYVHNFSNFDSIFLVKYLVTEANGFKINRRNGNIISIVFEKKINYKGKNIKIKLIFKDSYLILNSSLAKLAKTFNVENKGNFDVLQLKKGYNRAVLRNELQNRV